MVSDGKPAKKRPAKKAAPAATVTIASHRDFVARRAEVLAALRARPDLLPLLVVNPALAFRDAGIELTPEMADHVLHAVRHPPAVAAERAELEALLEEALGEKARPTDPAWLATTLFERLGVKPLDVKGQVPAYRPAEDDETRQRLERLFARPRRKATTGVPLVPPRTGIRWLDLDAPVPKLKAARRAPARLPLEELWFYRDAHELVRPLLRLGVIQSSALRILGPEAYRAVRERERGHQVAGWIRGVSFRDEGRSPR